MIKTNFIMIAVASFVIEVSSTMYISTVADKSFSMVFWALIGPFLSLPFIGFMIEAKNWNERFKVAVASSIGYSIGSIVVYLFFAKFLAF